MSNFFHKDTSKFILCVLSFAIILSCVRRNKFDFEKNALSDKKMVAVMTDIFLMEAYVNEKMPNTNGDTLISIKIPFYKKILSYHKVDSTSFYTTFNYLQAHPNEFSKILNMVDSSLNKIKPEDTTVIKQVVTVPKNIEKLPNFKEQEKVLQEGYIKDKVTHKKNGANQKNDN